tara:strand:+ start:81 stop:950 length:870 start_codon:yes stop_codon:yes gene_type:complete
MIKYTINDFKEINKNHKSVLKEDILKNINNLANFVGCPNYKKTPIFKENKKWKKIKNFKNTKLKKTEESIDCITSLLNKLTSKNYDIIKNEIIENMHNLIKNETSLKKMEELSLFIFNIASKNKFWSKIYAKLYVDLINEFSIMKDICKKNFNNLLELFKNIRIGDAEKNYELFCQINNENEKRKSICCFFVNLMIYGIIEENEIINLIFSLTNIFKNNINNIDYKNINYEICENLYILIKEISSVVKNKKDFETIKSFVKYITDLKFNNYKGLSSKTYFKFLDLYDEI